MKNQEQNDKLCKLLEIEPKEYYRPDDEIYWGRKEESMRDLEVLYPDLYAPDNFVKLFRLYGIICSQVIIHMSKTGEELEDDLIKEVISAIENRNNKFRRLIIEQAKQITWNY